MYKKCLRNMLPYQVLCQVALALCVVELHTASADTFYIVTSPSSPCPGEFVGVPCLTLQQYASNPSQSENITFLVESGAYNLSTVLPVSNGFNFTMSSENATVTCTSTNAGFRVSSVENVYISGMTFQRCRNAVQMSSVTRGILTNNVFQNTDHYRTFDRFQGALYITLSNVTINRSVFVHNTQRAIHLDYRWTSNGNRYSTITIDSSEFRYNTYRFGSGAAIYLDGYFNRRDSVDLFIHRSVFSNNRGSDIVYEGGAVYITGDVQLNLHVNNTVFSDNIAVRGGGGAIYNDGSNGRLLIHQSYFVNNRASTFGGAISVSGENSSVSVSGSSFINNTAGREGGGAIYSNGFNANVTLSSSTFTHNTASYCGVLDVDNYKHNVNMSNSVFTYNTAYGQNIGGGVACIRNASISIVNSTFKHNFASQHAGVFFIDESETTIDGSSFVNNTAALDGGVFYTYVHASDYIIRSSQFSYNTAGDDGGVMLIGRLNSFVNIDESVFDHNSASDRGGVIAIVASSMHMDINRTNIFNNTAQFGGVISACNSQITFVDDILTVGVDPLLSFCMLYEGDIRNFNITLPQDPEIAMTTAPPTTTALPTTMAPLTTTSDTATTPTVTVPPSATTVPHTVTTVSTTTTGQHTTDTPAPTTADGMLPTTEATQDTPPTTEASQATSTTAQNTPPATETTGTPPNTAVDETPSPSTDQGTATVPRSSDSPTSQPNSNDSLRTTETTISTPSAPVTSREAIVTPNVTRLDASIDTTGMEVDNRDNDQNAVALTTEYKLLSIALAAVSLLVSLVTVIAVFILGFLLYSSFTKKFKTMSCEFKAKSVETLKVSKTNEVAATGFGSNNTSLDYISPIYNTCYDEEKK